MATQRLRATICLLAVVRLYSATIVEDVSDLATRKFDYIVVGGGNAGNVIANRLSENPIFSVLLLEAGGSHEGIEDIQVPFFWTRLAPSTQLDWNYTTTAQPHLNGRSFPFPQGRVLGGSSSVNTMAYTRGSSDDYDRYARVTGDPGWSWKNLQKYIRKSERWTHPADGHNITGQYDPSAHGFNGTTSVCLPGYPLDTDHRVLAAAAELPGEFPYNVDLNAGSPLGIGWAPATVKNGERDSSATSYLSRDVLRRTNLHVLLHTQVTRVLQTGNRNGRRSFRTVEFVDSRSRGRRRTLTAKKEVILSAGAVGSPFILLHSGIGDSADLKRVGIKPIIHLPSVGRNLSDHAMAPLLWTVNTTDTQETWTRDPVFAAKALESWRTTRTGPFVVTPITQLGYVRVKDDGDLFRKYGDPSAGPRSAHVELLITNGIGINIPPTGNFFFIGAIIVSPHSRGSLALNSSNPFKHPIIDPAVLSSDIDMYIVREGLRSAQRFAEAPSIKSYVGPAVFSPKTDAELDEFIRANGANFNHPIGTAAMSAETSDYGVVDPDLRVKGVDGLRVIDASVFPFVPSAHTMAATYLIAERGADLIRRSYKPGNVVE